MANIFCAALVLFIKISELSAMTTIGSKKLSLIIWLMFKVLITQLVVSCLVTVQGRSGYRSDIFYLVPESLS